MNKLLVIGGSTPNGIGATIAYWAQQWRVFDEGLFSGIDVPSEMELNVQSARSVHDYVAANGPWTHIVYSAGKASLQWIEDLLSEDEITTGQTYPIFQEIFDINVFGFLRVLSCLKRTQGEGRILAITSDAAKIPMRGSMAYCSSKAALTMAIRVAAREMAPNWIVNGIAPAIVEGTNMTEYIDSTVPTFRGWSPEKAREYERSQIPMGRRARVDEVATIALTTLTGPEFLTGSIIDVTGGK